MRHLGSRLLAFANFISNNPFSHSHFGSFLCPPSALDPAGLFFTGMPTGARLHRTDAVFVDVVHTNGGSPLNSFGMSQAIGTVDFYVNGGSTQPPCFEKGTSLGKQEEQPILVNSSAIWFYEVGAAHGRGFKKSSGEKNWGIMSLNENWSLTRDQILFCLSLKMFARISLNWTTEELCVNWNSAQEAQIIFIFFMSKV